MGVLKDIKPPDGAEELTVWNPLEAGEEKKGETIDENTNFEISK
ncbi:MAG: hypothetical protein WAX07_03280 [Candidatus Altiarchaeia archaeon]